jgi:hypothetical protein
MGLLGVLHACTCLDKAVVSAPCWHAYSLIVLICFMLSGRYLVSAWNFEGREGAIVEFTAWCADSREWFCQEHF